VRNNCVGITSRTSRKGPCPDGYEPIVQRLRKQLLVVRGAQVCFDADSVRFGDVASCVGCLAGVCVAGGVDRHVDPLCELQTVFMQERRPFGAVWPVILEIRDCGGHSANALRIISGVCVYFRVGIVFVFSAQFIRLFLFLHFFRVLVSLGIQNQTKTTGCCFRSVAGHKYVCELGSRDRLHCLGLCCDGLSQRSC
jgi:hypothetical protein